MVAIGLLEIIILVFVFEVAAGLVVLVGLDLVVLYLFVELKIELKIGLNFVDD